jgi:hypothetical protein
MRSFWTLGSGAGAAVLALACILYAGPASAQAVGETCTPILDERPGEDQFLTDDELREVFTDRELNGCYPNGESWAERTARDGALYDNLQGGALVGEWWVADGQICYFYPELYASREDAPCWEVIRQDGAYYFFFPGTSEIGGASYPGALTS